MTALPSPGSALLLADGLLAAAAAAGAGALLARRPVVPASALYLVLAALALSGGAHAAAPWAGGAAVALAGCAAGAAWAAAATLFRRGRHAGDGGERTRLLEAALSVCGDGVVIATADGLTGLRIAYSNAAFEHLTGYSSDEAVGLSPSVLAAEPDGLEVIRQAVRSPAPVRVELPGRRKDGTRVWAEWQVVPVAGPDGRHAHSVAVLRDTTDRRRAEQALRDSEARTRALFERAADVILVLDPADRIVDANRQACHALGYTRAELTAMRGADLEVPGSRSDHAAETGTAESTYRRKDGSTLAVEVRYALVEAAGGAVNLALARDVTRRRQAERALREREELLRSVVAHIPCGVFWKDRDSVYLGCNDQVARDYGLAAAGQLVGRRDDDFARDPAEAAFYRECDLQVMDGGEPILNLEQTHTRPDGSRAIVLTSKVPLRDLRGRVVGVLGVYRDVTEWKRLEEQLRQAQKMEAVGRLAGGIAHDFNNLLTVIRGNAELLRPADGAGDGPLFADLLLAADRAAALVRQLLMFSRRQAARAEVLDLNAVVGGLLPLLRRLLGERVAVEADLAAAPVTVRADRGHVEQVLMNLAVNARDAMPAGGTLTVRTEAAERAAAGGPGRVARLTVADTGTGMSDEVRARIFEPFFTTKGPDKGTGLGLATVFGIVQQADGAIDVETAPGAGATFRVDLPWWSGPPSAVAPPPARRPAERAERPAAVLLVEDQDPIRRFARLALEGAGHRVCEAEDGEGALRLTDAGQPFDVLVSDVTMPGIDGRELAARVRERRPDVAVVLMSGYAPDADGLEPVERAVFLAKPFPPAELVAAVKKAQRSAAQPPRCAG